MLTYIIILYFMAISKNVIETALLFALFVILIGLELIIKNYWLSGLIIITVYVGAVIILLVFIMMNLNLNENIISIQNWNWLILIFLIPISSDKINIESWDYNVEYNPVYLLGTQILEENPINIYLLLILLLLTLVCSITISRRLF